MLTIVGVALERHAGEHAPLTATVCSSIKFTLMVIAYVLCGLAARLRRGAQITPRHSDDT